MRYIVPPIEGTSLIRALRIEAVASLVGHVHSGCRAEESLAIIAVVDVEIELVGIPTDGTIEIFQRRVE